MLHPLKVFNYIIVAKRVVISFSIDKNARLLRRTVVICERKRAFILFTDENICSTLHNFWGIVIRIWYKLYTSGKIYLSMTSSTSIKVSSWDSFCRAINERKTSISQSLMSIAYSSDSVFSSYLIRKIWEFGIGQSCQTRNWPTFPSSRQPISDKKKQLLSTFEKL